MSHINAQNFDIVLLGLSPKKACTCVSYLACLHCLRPDELEFLLTAITGVLHKCSTDKWLSTVFLPKRTRKRGKKKRIASKVIMKLRYKSLSIKFVCIEREGYVLCIGPVSEVG